MPDGDELAQPSGMKKKALFLVLALWMSWIGG